MDWYSGLLLADAMMAGVVLAVQLVVYPGFMHFRPEDLARWHPVYTRSITVLVAPLMAAQLVGGILWVRSDPSPGPGLYLLAILSVWAMTLRYFIPLHRQIGRGTADTLTFRRLLRLNRVRTLLWLFVLVWHLLNY